MPNLYQLVKRKWSRIYPNNNNKPSVAPGSSVSSTSKICKYGKGDNHSTSISEVSLNSKVPYTTRNLVHVKSGFTKNKLCQQGIGDVKATYDSNSSDDSVRDPFRENVIKSGVLRRSNSISEATDNEETIPSSFCDDIIFTEKPKNATPLLRTPVSLCRDNSVNMNWYTVSLFEVNIVKGLKTGYEYYTYAYPKSSEIMTENAITSRYVIADYRSNELYRKINTWLLENQSTTISTSVNTEISSLYSPISDEVKRSESPVKTRKKKGVLHFKPIETYKTGRNLSTSAYTRNLQLNGIYPTNQFCTASTAALNYLKICKTKFYRHR